MASKRKTTKPRQQKANQEAEGSKKKKTNEEALEIETANDFSNRSIKVERYVNLGELKETSVPQIVETLKWEAFVQQQGRANVNVVREFYAGINPATIDYTNLTLESKVRGVKLTFSADKIASTVGINRPNADQFQFPYLTEENLPKNDDIVQDLYVDEMCNQKRWQVKFLTASKAVLNLILKANLDPRGTRASFNDEYARLLYETHRCTAIDVGKIIWQVVGSVYRSEDSPALPYGLLITKICLAAGVKRRVTDEFQNQMEPIGRISMTRTQGQSSKSRAAVTMETVISRLDEVSARLDTMSSQMKDLVKMVQQLIKENEKLKKKAKEAEEKTKEAEEKDTDDKDGEEENGDGEDDGDDEDEDGEDDGDDEEEGEDDDD